MNARMRHAAWCAGFLGLFAACVLSYWAGLHGSFLMDDFGAIQPLVDTAGHASWRDALWNAPGHVRSRWVSNATFLLSNAARPAADHPAFWFKLGNLGIHLACGALVAALGFSLCRRWQVERQRALAIAWIASALFLMHPLLVSTTLYVVQRMAQLATLFSLLAVLAYVRWRADWIHRSMAAHVGGIALVVLATVLAVFSKENGALTPLLVLAVELTAFAWPARGDATRERFESGFGICCFGPILLGLLLLGLKWDAFQAGYAIRDYTLQDRLLTQVHVLSGYVAQIAWPRIGSMGLYQDHVDVVRGLDATTVVLALAWLAALLGAVLLRKRLPVLALAVLWFLAAHAMESTVLPLELAFEHRNYMALFGPVLLVAWWIGHRPRLLAIAIVAVVLAALSWQTVRRVQDWSSYGRWIRAEAAHHPDSMRAASDLIAFLAAVGDLAGASTALDRLRERFPTHGQPAVLALSLRCNATGPIATTVSREDRQLLGQGLIGKDAYHLYLGARERKRGGSCAAVSWNDFGQVAGAILSNPAIQSSPPAAEAWARLHAEALAEQSRWQEAAAAIDGVLRTRGDDPRDWLLLMEARAALGDVAGYGAARSGLVRLLQGDLGPHAGTVRQLDLEIAQLLDQQSSGASEPAPPDGS